MSRVNVLLVSKVLRESPDLTLTEQAEISGLSRRTFRAARDVIVLFDEDNLTIEEEGVIATAISDLAEGKIAKVNESVAPLIRRRFGDLSRSNYSPTNERDRQREICRDAISAVVSTMEFSRDIPVPWFDIDERTRLCQDLDQAMESVETLKNTIMGGGTDNV